MGELGIKPGLETLEIEPRGRMKVGTVIPPNSQERNEQRC